MKLHADVYIKISLLLTIFTNILTLSARQNMIFERGGMIDNPLTERRHIKRFHLPLLRDLQIA